MYNITRGPWTALPALINTKGTGHKLTKKITLEKNIQNSCNFPPKHTMCGKIIKTATKSPLSLAKPHTPQEDLMKL